MSTVGYRESMIKARTAVVLVALALGASLTACFPAQQSRPVEQAPAEAEAEQLPDNCLSITDGALAKLAGKIADTVAGAEVLRTGLVASESSEMWVIAVEFSDPGLDREFVGIWGSLQNLTTDQDPAFIAVDEVAEASAEYLQPVDFDGVGAQLPSAEDAVACLA